MIRSRKNWFIALCVLAVATMLGGGLFWYASSADREDVALRNGGPDAADGDDDEEADGEKSKRSSGGKNLTNENDAGSSGDERLSEEEFQRRIAEKLKSGELRLPRGVTDIEGLGGAGFNLSFKKNGVWFPVYGPPGASADDAVDGASSPEERPLAEYPLMIASPSPPRGRMDEPYAFRFQAMGGAPPYQWSMSLAGAEGAAFSLNPASGDFAGASPVPVTARLSVSVSDSEGAGASATYALVMEPASPLKILTTVLDPVAAEEPSSQSLAADGGVPPYEWSTASPLPTGLTLAPTGEIQGTAEESGVFQIEVSVKDAQLSEATAMLALTVSEGLEIITDSTLVPAAPGSPYSMRFEAAGGVEPHTWHLVEGAMPVAPTGATWSLSPEGVLAGTAPGGESFHRFSIEVRDAAGAKFRKTFELAVRGGLIAVPSRNKAGLAWRPAEIAAALGAPIGGVTVTRAVMSGAQTGAPLVIYQGAGSNVVDRGLPTGVSLRYTLIAHTTAGAIPFTSTVITILPMIRDMRGEKAVPGVTADPFADAVVAFQPLTAGGYGSSRLPWNVTGAPNGPESQELEQPAYQEDHVLSLHAKTGAPGDALGAHGGAITLAFTDNIIELEPGVDFTVFENVLFTNGNPNARFMEPAVVEVALFENQWFRFPTDVVPGGETPNPANPFYYRAGFAGINHTLRTDPTNPQVSGGDSFDADQLQIAGLTWARFIRIQSTGDNVLLDTIGGEPVRHTVANYALLGRSASGFDLDAVSAVNY